MQVVDPAHISIWLISVIVEIKHIRYRDPAHFSSLHSRHIYLNTAYGNHRHWEHFPIITWHQKYMNTTPFFLTRSSFRQRHSSSNVIWWNFHIVWRKTSFASIPWHEITSVSRPSFPEGYRWRNSHIIFKQHFQALTGWFVNVGWAYLKFIKLKKKI